jgi:hypothetical protein
MGQACGAIALQRPEFGAVSRLPKKLLMATSCRRKKIGWMTVLASVVSLFDAASIVHRMHSVDAIASHHFEEL